MAGDAIQTARVEFNQSQFGQPMIAFELTRSVKTIVINVPGMSLPRPRDQRPNNVGCPRPEVRQSARAAPGLPAASHRANSY